MDINEINSLFKETFGSINSDNTSFKSFVNMLHDFEKISDDEYYDLSQRLSLGTVNLDESYSYRLIPTIYEFLSESEEKDNVDIYYDLKLKLSNSEIVIFKISDEESIKFIKQYNDIGISYWISDIEGEVSTDYLIDKIYNFINDQGYKIVPHGKYLNIRLEDSNEYINVSSLKNKLREFYKIIFGNYPEYDIDNYWNKYLNYVEKANIITSEQKTKLYNDKELDKDKTSNEANEDLQNS